MTDDPAQLGNTESTADANLEKSLEDLTVAQLLSLLIRKPMATKRRFQPAAAAPALLSEAATSPPSSTQAAGLAGDWQRRAGRLLQEKHLQLLLYLAALLFAYIGSVYGRGSPEISRANYYSMEVAAPYLWAGFLLWLLAELVGNWQALRTGWRRLDAADRWRWLARIAPALIWVNAVFMLGTSLNAPTDESVPMAAVALLRMAIGGVAWLGINLMFRFFRGRQPPLNPGEAVDDPPLIHQRQPLRLPIWRDISPLRAVTFGIACLCSLHVWEDSTGNYIPLNTIQVWFVAALLWCCVFAPLRWNIFDSASKTIDHWRRIRWRNYRGVIIAFALLMLLGFSFRYDMLDQHPRYLYGDLVEKIQDAHKIYYHDDYRIFMENIGGREPLHFYLLSVLASQEGMNFDHFALKSMTALWSILALPLMFWLAVEAFYGLKRDRRWSLIVGLAMLGLVAGSFWHVMLGRQGLRTGVTSFWTPAIMIFFVRALRSNRRVNFILAGLCLGFGLISYQAMRMMPASIVAGVLTALLVRRYSWRERASYLLNLAVLATVAFTVFMPIMRYWTEYPEDYMRRTSTRIFGDMPTSPEERTEFLLENGARLLKNWHDQLLMVHYNGEATFISSAPDKPHFDPLVAALITLGVAAWIALMAKTRDQFVWYMPAFLFFAMLPSALALSFSIEVPSLTRGNTAITPLYLIAALPLALICRQIYRCLPKRLGWLAGVGFGALVILASNEYNADYYFGYFTDNFNASSHPYVEVGNVLRGFVESDGAFGNAFVVAIPHWLDHRAVGIEAGVMYFDNGGFINNIPWLIRRNFLSPGSWTLVPQRDLLFIYANADLETPQVLAEWFPQGRSLFIEAHHPNRGFYIYRVPALGAQGINDFIDQYAS
ncbi:MAG: hypothetical protein OXH48_02535 [Chloroflexi bacterium]|nr:hypothetical protein [Chloroflexota bacterium]MCY3583167.1 hypothetical protein [Chloroflexota bacterium]